jgi:hypothetical protein
MVPAVAGKVFQVLPAATVTDSGTESKVLLLLKATEAPPEGATCERVTVQVLAAADPRLVGEQASEETAMGASEVTVPATPAIDSELPPAEAPRVFVTAIGALVAVDAVVTVTTATTPFWIAVEFSPATKQV